MRYNISDVFSNADDGLIEGITRNGNQLLHAYFTKRHSLYNFRQKSHNTSLIIKTTHLHECNFIIDT